MNTNTYAATSAAERKLKATRIDLANSMVGRTVSLMVDARHVTKGIVAGVLFEADAPKIVVNGTSYDPRQVLSSWPTFITA